MASPRRPSSFAYPMKRLRGTVVSLLSIFQAYSNAPITKAGANGQAVSAKPPIKGLRCP